MVYLVEWEQITPDARDAFIFEKSFAEAVEVTCTSRDFGKKIDVGSGGINVVWTLDVWYLV
jgi:hypothetical protein